MGTMSFPYENSKIATSFVAALKKPMFVSLSKEGDITTKNIPHFVSDDLFDDLAVYFKTHPKIHTFDARPVVKTLLTKWIKQEEQWLLKKQKLTFTNNPTAKDVEAVNIIRLSLALKPLDFTPSAHQQKKVKPRAISSGLPYHNIRRARGLVKKLKQAWYLKIYNKIYQDRNKCRVNTYPLSQYMYYKELNEKIERNAKSNMSQIDITPIVKKFVQQLLKEEEGNYKRTGKFLNPDADFDAVNELRVFLKMKKL